MQSHFGSSYEMDLKLSGAAMLWSSCCTQNSHILHFRSAQGWHLLLLVQVMLELSTSKQSTGSQMAQWEGLRASRVVADRGNVVPTDLVVSIDMGYAACCFPIMQCDWKLAVTCCRDSSSCKNTILEPASMALIRISCGPGAGLPSLRAA